MPGSTPRPGIPAAITFVVFFVAVIAASAIRLAGNLDGRFGFILFLLIMGTPVVVATGVAVTTWRLMLRFLPLSVGVPERLLFAAATFVLACGSGPLVIFGAVVGITRQDAPVGAAFMWAVVSVIACGSLCIFGIAIAVLRLVLRQHNTTQSLTP